MGDDDCGEEDDGGDYEDDDDDDNDDGVQKGHIKSSFAIDRKFYNVKATGGKPAC